MPEQLPSMTFQLLKFESTRWQFLSKLYLFTVHCIENRKIKIKLSGFFLQKNDARNTMLIS